MSVTNIAQGANKNIHWTGVREMKLVIDNLVGATIGDEAARVAGEAARIGHDQAYANAKSVNLSRKALQDFYVYDKQPAGLIRKKHVTALFGIKKRGKNENAKGYVKWFPGKQVGRGQEAKTNFAKRKRDKFVIVMPGARNKDGSKVMIGENLATMREFGTTKERARPFFRPAITQSRNAMFQCLAIGYRGIIQRHSAK